jgi:glycosyltransferase involved in cell wall biosynthesis
LSPKEGGPSFALPLIARSLAAQGITLDVATTDDDGPGGHLNVPLHQPCKRDTYRAFFFRKQTEFYKFSLPFSNWMAAHVRDYNLVHIHALFSFTSCSAARHAHRHQVPYIIRPLGVLNRWGMQNRRRWLKALSFRFVETPILQNAAAIHYTSQREQMEAEEAGSRARALVIPLGLDLAPFLQLPVAEDFFREHPSARGRKILLYLSRIDAKKGLDVLLPAFAQLHREHPDCLLVIAGGGPEEIVRKFQAQAAREHISDAVLWTGFLEGESKLAAFAAASVFVLPSYSENFGIAAVEALAAGLPCVLSTGVAVAEDVAAAEAGLVAPPEPDALAEALRKLFSDENLRQSCAQRARALASNRFSLEAMGKNLSAAYRDILARSVSK